MPSMSTMLRRTAPAFAAGRNPVVIASGRAPLSSRCSSSAPSSASPMGRRPLLHLLTGGMAAIAGGGRGVAAAAAAAPTAAEQVLLDPQWPAEWPWRAEDHFQRYDESADAAFYESPRFVAHIDDAAIQSLTGYYAEVFPSSGSQNTALLDVCSSWISHYPPGYAAGRISGLGMNAEELKRNPVLSDYEVRDLNAEPVLPYADNTFDVVTNTVSVDYLTRPLEVFRETQRVLKPGGLAIMSFSNRCFPTKAVAVWTSTGDLDHCWIVGSYFHYAGGFEPPQSKEITRVGLLGNRGDPMYVVTARKLA